MRVPLSWLREFVTFDQSVDPPVDELADTFNELGLIVDGIERIGEGLQGVVVGRAVDVRIHPNADKVRLADVDLGTGKTVQIACGAVNLAAGQLVPVATIGTTLPNGMTIEKRKLRGEVSNGMICSADELGLGTGVEHGIFVLPDDLAVGDDFATAMGIEPDVVFDLEIETNRPDAMCVTGVARDLAGKLNLPFRVPEPSVAETGPRVDELSSVSVTTPDLCPRFTVRVIQNVKVAPSPALIARRLELAGMRPINNVVDASNYVMLELGQPSHPYDAALVRDSTLGVRRSRNGEAIETLDGSLRSVPDGTCVITDGSDCVVGVAGIMGGASSEISGSTTTVINECAVWEPYAINFASRSLALRTEASARFERRIDRTALDRAQLRFCELLLQSCPDAVVASGMVDVDATDRWPNETEQIRLRTVRVNAILGTQLTAIEISGYLKRIGFGVGGVDADGVMTVTVPPFRPDVEREIDIIEEVARIHGYDNIERRVPTSSTAARLTAYQQQRRLTKTLLVGRGYTEVWSSAMLGEDDYRRSGITATPVAVANPMTKEDALLRTSLLPSVLKVIAYNVARRNDVLHIFEVGHVFNRPSPGEKLADEREHLAVAILDPKSDARSASMVLRDLEQLLRTGESRLTPAVRDGMHPTRTAEIQDGVGVVGEIDPDVLGRYGIEGRVGWIELDLEKLLARVDTAPQMQPVSRYPSAEFDLALVVSDAVPAQQVGSTLRSSLGELHESVTLFDVYRGGNVADGSRSLAYRLRVSSSNSTLDDKQIADIRTKVLDAAAEAHGATLRE